MELDKEMQFYEQHKDEFLKHYENQFVLIKGDVFAGSYTTEEEAYEAGLKRFGNQPFLIQEVLKEEPVYYFPALSLGVMNARS